MRYHPFDKDHSVFCQGCSNDATATGKPVPADVLKIELAISQVRLASSAWEGEPIVNDYICKALWLLEWAKLTATGEADSSLTGSWLLGRFTQRG